MSAQILLQGKLLGIREFLLSPAHPDDLAGGRTAEERLLTGRSHWVSLLTEVLPRALLAEFGLPKVLLGSSSSGQFMLVLTEEMRPRAEEFLATAAQAVERMSGGFLRLVWASTEELGDWAVVRRRLNEEMHRKRGPAAPEACADFFAPAPVAEPAAAGGYFTNDLCLGLREASEVGWSPGNPAEIVLGRGKYWWSLNSALEGIPLARHTAPSDDGVLPATAPALAARAQGLPAWGVLRGDVDGFGIRLRRLLAADEHLRVSDLYKRFFAGELEVLCSMGDFWRKVTILYSGGDDFAAYGAWDALIQLARELQRMFRRFGEEILKEFPGPEGKTLSMALELAPGPDASLLEVFDAAGRGLERSKSAGKDSFALFGRSIEWRHLAGASDLKDTCMRIVNEFGGSTVFLREVAAFYRERGFRPAAAPGRRRDDELDRPWRFHARVNRALPVAKDRDLEKLRTGLITELIGRNAAHAKLRPAGRVALEWARLLTEA